MSLIFSRLLSGLGVYLFFSRLKINFSLLFSIFLSFSTFTFELEGDFSFLTSWLFLFLNLNSFDCGIILSLLAIYSVKEKLNSSPLLFKFSSKQLFFENNVGFIDILQFCFESFSFIYFFSGILAILFSSISAFFESPRCFIYDF